MHFQVCKGRLGFYFGYEARLISYTRAYCCVWWTSPPTCENAATSLSWLNFLFLQRREKVRGGGEDLLHPPIPARLGVFQHHGQQPAALKPHHTLIFQPPHIACEGWEQKQHWVHLAHTRAALGIVLTLALVMFRPKDSTHQSSQKVGPAQFSPTQRSVS